MTAWTDAHTCRAKLESAGIPFARRSALDDHTRLQLPGVLLLDTIGELSRILSRADVVFMVGYHGSISGEGSVLSHTYNPSVVSHVDLNGVRVGESGINALVALACQAPVGPGRT